MKARIINLKASTKEEVKQIRKFANEQLSFPVRVTYNKEKYARGSFNILPSKKTGSRFNEDQSREIIKFIKENNFYKNDLNLEYAHTCFWQGFSYIFKLA